MGEFVVRKAPLPWLVGGIVLGLIQVIAFAVKGPLGVSTQFVVADTQVLEAVAPGYVEGHPLIGTDKYRQPGYGWWLDVGLIIGAAAAAVACGRWRLRTSAVWWDANGRSAPLGRFIACFAGGLLILLGSRLAHGCTSGQFASGWAQLSVSVLPFTVALFGFGMLTALLVYRHTPEIER